MKQQTTINDHFTRKTVLSFLLRGLKTSLRGPWEAVMQQIVTQKLTRCLGVEHSMSFISFESAVWSQCCKHRSLGSLWLATSVTHCSVFNMCNASVSSRLHLKFSNLRSHKAAQSVKILRWEELPVCEDNHDILGCILLCLGHVGIMFNIVNLEVLSQGEILTMR